MGLFVRRGSAVITIANTTQPIYKTNVLSSHGYKSDFVLAMVMQLFSRIVASPARGENRTYVATLAQVMLPLTEKSQKK